MAEEAPELIEQVGGGPAGATWRARRTDGQEVLVFQTVLIDETARQAGLDRLRRLARLQTPRLAPVRGWWADGEGVWVVLDLEQGVSLPDLPGGGFLSPQQAAAISFGILEGLEALHSEGLNHGGLAAEGVRVMPDGNVRLTGHQLATLTFPSQDDLVAELRDAGRLVCQAFGITPERDSRAAPRAIEHAAPALVVTARALAAGSMRSDVNSAISALRETSGPLGGSERLALGAGELAALVAVKRGGVAGRQVSYRNLNAPIGSGSLAVPASPAPAPAVRPLPAPAATPAATPAAAPAPGPTAPAAAAGAASTAPGRTPPTAPRRSWEERTVQQPPVSELDDVRQGPNWRLIGGVLAAVVVLGLGAWFGRGLLAGGGSSGNGGQPQATPSGAAVQSPRASPVSSPSTPPGQVPVFAPAAAGAVKSVTLKATTASCAPGASCTFNVVIVFTPAGAAHDVTWSFKTVDLCSSAVTTLGGGLITADGTWNTTDGNTTIPLPPARGQLAVVALSGPDVAASTPVVLGTSGC